MFLGFTVPLVASIALLRHQLRPVMALAGGAAAFWLFFSPGWHLQALNDFNYFTFPIEAYMGRAVLAKLHETPAAILLALGLLAVVVLASTPRLRRWLPVMLVPAALFQLTATGYALKNHVNSVGAHHGPDLRALAWVDTHVPNDEDVGILAVADGLTGDYNSIWREIQYWNTTVRTVVTIVSPITYFPSADVPYPFATHAITAPLDLATGRVTWKGPFPRHLVIPQPPLSVVLNWSRVSQAGYIPASLVRVARPLQARSTLSGVTPAGLTNPKDPAMITVYRAARPRVRCVYADLVPLLLRPRMAVRLGYGVEHANKTIARGRITNSHMRRIYMPVTFRGPSETFELHTDGRISEATGALPLKVGDYEPLPTPCPA
jgi:hypothetical protein